MTYKIKFGTDGWRGTIAEDYTFDNVRRAAHPQPTFWPLLILCCTILTAAWLSILPTARGWL